MFSQRRSRSAARSAVRSAASLFRQRDRARAASCVLALWCALLWAASAHAATIRGPADVATLTAASDAVVRARVVSQQSAWAGGSPQSGLIHTTVVLEPTEWWKGSGEGRISVRVPGGAVGEWDQTVHGCPRFREGEEVVVFLRAPGPAAPKARATAPLYEVERWSLGKFVVGSVAGGRVRAARDRTGLTCVGCGADEQDELPLDELRGRVAAALRAPPPKAR